MTEKIQIYASDLSKILNIGEIVDMHVTTSDSGWQILRIEAMNVKTEEFKTLALPGKVSGTKKDPAKKSARQPREPSGPKRGILGGALSTVFGDDYRNQKPPWEKW